MPTNSDLVLNREQVEQLQATPLVDTGYIQLLCRTALAAMDRVAKLEAENAELRAALVDVGRVPTAKGAEAYNDALLTTPLAIAYDFDVSTYPTATGAIRELLEKTAHRWSSEPEPGWAELLAQIAVPDAKGNDDGQ